MNAARRQRKRERHIATGSHAHVGVAEWNIAKVLRQDEARRRGRQTPMAMKCPVCRPGPRLAAWKDEVAGWRQ